MSANILLNQENGPSNRLSAKSLVPDLPLGGITRFTTIDFPGRLAAVLYTQGCGWSCRYCHNSHLQPFESGETILFERAVQFLEGRAGLLDGVIFCGGEPTLQAKLPAAMRFVREMGFQTGLHTTGINPERLKEALNFCDWVGMDIKAPFDLYEKVTQRKGSGVEPKKSVCVILGSGLDYEFRTTVHPALLSEENILEIAKDLSAMGAKNFVLQAFQSNGCVDEVLKKSPVPEPIISQELQDKLTHLFPAFKIRQ